MDGQLLQLQTEEMSLLSHKKLDSIIASKSFKHIPKNMQSKILDLRDLVDRY